MVTEKAGYIGTSNWAEDYFTDTAGKRERVFLSEKKVKNTLEIFFVKLISFMYSSSGIIKIML